MQLLRSCSKIYTNIRKNKKSHFKLEKQISPPDLWKIEGKRFYLQIVLCHFVFRRPSNKGKIWLEDMPVWTYAAAIRRTRDTALEVQLILNAVQVLRNAPVLVITEFWKNELKKPDLIVTGDTIKDAGIYLFDGNTHTVESNYTQ